LSTQVYLPDCRFSKTPNHLTLQKCYLNFFKSQDVLPTSTVLSYQIWLNMYTVHLDTSGMIHNFQLIAAIANH